MRIHFERPDIPALRREFMLVDLHFHSAHSHDCSTPVPEIVARAEELDVFVALTDHNVIAGVLEGERLNPGRLKPGLEVTTWEGKDVLLYFPRVDDLEDFFSHSVAPFVRPNRSSLGSCRTRLGMRGLFEAAEESEALVCLAHPFVPGPRRSYPYFAKNEGYVRCSDAVEVINLACPHKSNLMAVGWAAQHDKPISGGSDGHSLAMLGTAFTASRARDWPAFLDSVRRKEALVIGEERNFRHQINHVTTVLSEKAKVFASAKSRV